MATEKDIEGQFKKVESITEAAQNEMTTLSNMLVVNSASGGVSLHRTATARLYAGETHRHLGKAGYSIISLHRKVAELDPRPQPKDGGGDK